MTVRPRLGRGQSPITVRLALTFVAVALIAVAIVLGLSVALGGRDINAMVQERRDDLTQSLRANAAATYNTGKPGWSDADLRPALDLAARSGTNVAVLDADHHLVAATAIDPTRLSDVEQTPITVAGRQVGTLVVSFNGHGLVASAGKLRSSLDKAVIGAAGLAALLALAIALLLARRLTRPLEQLIAAAEAMALGDRASRVGPVPRAPRELQELAAAFDGMAVALAEQEKLREELVADVAHELRTPVAILQANCEALVDGVVPHTPEQTVSLHEEVVRLAGLVDDLQSLANADAAALHLQVVPCDLAAVAATALDAMATTLSAARLTVTRQLDAAPIEGDPARLHQVVTNVLGNAAKFTSAGGRIHVVVTRDDGSALLRVSDTGPGIAVEDQSHVFQRFWRGPNSDRTTGSGVGLAVVAELVAAHHGRVDLRSEVGVGTTVTISFPLRSVGAVAR